MVWRSKKTQISNQKLGNKNQTSAKCLVLITQFRTFHFQFELYYFMKNIIKEIIQENQHAELPQPMERNINIDIESKIIVTLVGVRRSGKTYLL